MEKNINLFQCLLTHHNYSLPFQLSHDYFFLLSPCCSFHNSAMDCSSPPGGNGCNCFMGRQHTAQQTKMQRGLSNWARTLLASIPEAGHGGATWRPAGWTTASACGTSPPAARPGHCAGIHAGRSATGCLHGEVSYEIEKKCLVVELQPNPCPFSRTKCGSLVLEMVNKRGQICTLAMKCAWFSSLSTAPSIYICHETLLAAN